MAIPEVILLPTATVQLTEVLNADFTKESCGVLGGKRTGNSFSVAYFLPVKNHARTKHCFIMQKKGIAEAVKVLNDKSLNFCGIFHTHFSERKLSLADKMSISATGWLWLIGISKTKKIYAYIDINGTITKLDLYA